MTINNANKPILHLKRWEPTNPTPVVSGAGMFVASSRHYRQQQLLVSTLANAFLYNPNEDGWQQLPAAGLVGTFGAGACGTAIAWSTGTTLAASLTATAGTTTTITTNQTLARDLRGYKVHILGGPNAGVTLTIAKNTIGANAVITFTTAQASAFSASTVYRLLTPVWLVLVPGTLAAGSFRKYCFATNSWVTLSQTGLAATLGTCGRLIATPSIVDGDYKVFAAQVTATSGTTTTIVHPTAAWATNQWANSQVRITGGAGAGQIRTIASNTANTLTVGTAFSPAPDSTSTFVIEGNDDFVYYTGNNATTFYRYQISTNTWTTLTARPGAAVAGVSGHWVWNVNDADWTNENAIQNGRYIYSLRGGSGVIDRYDIAAGTWTTPTYAPAGEIFGAGSSYVYSGNFLYIQKDATGRWFRLNFATSELEGWSTLTYTQGAAAEGDRAFDIVFTDGAGNFLTFVYFNINTSNVMLRQLVF